MSSAGVSPSLKAVPFCAARRAAFWFFRFLLSGPERTANDLSWNRLPGLNVLSLREQCRTDSYPLPRMTSGPTRWRDP